MTSAVAGAHGHGDDWLAQRDRTYGDRPQPLSDALGSTELPAPRAIVLDDVRWGYFDVVPTVAYWAAQIWLRR